MADVDVEARELAGFRGQLLVPGDDQYDAARQVFNGMVDRRPAVIARCIDAGDVTAAVGVARDRGWPLSVYGGGHGVPGYAVCDAGVCVDLRLMKRIKVDAEWHTVRAEGGATWGELDAATQAHGLAVTGGRVSTTGIAGLALGGGSGWLERKLGYTCDNLIAAEVVTADGRQVKASATEQPDLFWALRGGGGNFGVVTAFHFRLHRVGPTVQGGFLLHPAAAASRVVRFWRDFMLSAPDEVGSAVAFICAPNDERVPAPARGKPAVGIIVCYAGDPDEGARVLEPLVRFGPPAVELVQPMPYVALQQILDPGNPAGRLNYWTAEFLAEMPDAAVDTLAARATRPLSPFSQVIVVAAGGAIARVDEAAMACGLRQMPWNIHYISMWEDPADTDANIDHTKELSAAMRPWAPGRVYLNWIGDEGPDRVVAAFGPEKYRRLQAIKTAWDPENLFRLNQNITPEA